MGRLWGTKAMYRHGWYQIAFEHELTRDVTPVAVGERRLVVVRTQSGLRVADAVCPHRGAHLGFGGSYANGAIICPFHGLRIGLGEPMEHELCVHEYTTLAIGGLVFVLLSAQEDNGFTDLMKAFAESRTILPGFALKIRCQPELVIENAFDQAHFRPVHGVDTEKNFRMRPSEHGELGIDGMLNLPRSTWQRSQAEADGNLVRFSALAFSPGIVVSHLGGQHPYSMVTAATSTAEGECQARLSLMLSPSKDGRPPRQDLCDFLLRRSREGLERDRIIWEHRSDTAVSRFTSLDEPILRFQDFCARFRANSHEQTVSDA